MTKFFDLFKIFLSNDFFLGLELEQEEDSNNFYILERDLI